MEELVARYDVPRAVAAAWVAEEQVLPLLDGLDEVEAGQREGCVEAVNAFRESRRAGLVSLAVCCRTADYLALNTQLRLRGAVLLQTLSPAQVSAYVASGGPALASLGVALSEDPDLLALATSPLMLRLMSLTYRDAPAAGLSGADPETRRAALFSAYVERMFARGEHDPQLPQGQHRTLALLAGPGDDPPLAVRLLPRAAAAGLALLTGGTPALHARRPARLRARPGRPRRRRRGPGRSPPGLSSSPVLAAAGSRGPLFDGLVYGLPAAAIAGLFGDQRERGPQNRMVRAAVLAHRPQRHPGLALGGSPGRGRAGPGDGIHRGAGGPGDRAAAGAERGPGRGGRRAGGRRRRGPVLRVGEWLLLRPGGWAGRWADGRARPASRAVPPWWRPFAGRLPGRAGQRLEGRWPGRLWAGPSPC